MSNYRDIFDAAKNGTVEDVKYFVDQEGVSIYAKCSINHTPIEYAMLGENIEVIKYLVSKGVSIEPHWLISAAGFKKNSLEAVKFFVEKGINVNHRDSGMCPLHLAASNADIEVAKYLISKGADIGSVAGSGFTPLQLAEKHGNTELAKYISEKAYEASNKESFVKMVKYIAIGLGIVAILQMCRSC